MQFEPSATPRGNVTRLTSRAIAGLALGCIALVLAMPASAATLDRIKETGHIKFGYLHDARPFSYRNEAGAADGFAVALCQRIAEQVKTQLALPELTVDWVPVTMDSRLREVEEGKIDLLCAPTSVTLTRREEVAFSIPVFGGGNRAVVHADTVATLRAALAENPNTKPVWRGAPATRVLKNTTLAVVSGTTTERWLESQRVKLQIDAKVTPVTDYRAGLQQLLDRKVDVFFGDRTLVLGAMDDASRKNLVILDRLFTHEPVGLALARGDEDFRLTVDRALSRIYMSSGFPELYEKWCGPFDDNARTFFLWNTVSE